MTGGATGAFHNTPCSMISPDNLWVILIETWPRHKGKSVQQGVYDHYYLFTPYILDVARLKCYEKAQDFNSCSEHLQMSSMHCK